MQGPLQVIAQLSPLLYPLSLWFRVEGFGLRIQDLLRLRSGAPVRVLQTTWGERDGEGEWGKQEVGAKSEQGGRSEMGVRIKAAMQEAGGGWSVGLGRRVCRPKGEDEQRDDVRRCLVEEEGWDLS